MDLKKLPPELIEKLKKWEQNSPENQQLTTLNDIADISQEMLGVLDKQSASGDQNAEKFGALLLDMREALTALRDREAPELPDYAKPVLDGFQKLEKALTTALKAIDIKPNIKVDAPQVNVDSPSVNVDLKGVEKLLKTEMPKAFKEAIKLVPKTEIPKADYTPLLEKWDEIAKKLESIDTGTRMKPQFPISQLNAIKDSLEAGIEVTTGGLTDAELRASPVPVSGTVTADTELPTAAALSDTMANPTTPLIGAVNTGWDGATNHVRLRVGKADGATSTGLLNIAPMMHNGSTYDLLKGSAADGLTVNLGTNNDVTVTGSVTVGATTMPTTLLSFVTTVTTAGTRVQLASNTVTSGVLIQAPSTNTGNIYVGGSTVSATVFGAELQPGQSTAVAIDNTNKIYIDSSVSGEKLMTLGS